MHNIAWRIYVASERQLNNYATYCETGNEHVRCLGSIKNERFFTSKSGAQAAARIRSALGTTSTVLWNPHWSFGTGGWSTFVQNIAPIMRFFGEHRDRGLILRPHPNLLANLIAHSDRGTTLVADLRAMCRDLPNVYLDEDYDHLPAMLAADCLISDLSSIIPEYLGLNRPIGYLRLTGSDLEVNADSGWRDAAIDIDTEEALLAFLENPVTRAHQTNDRHDIGSGARIVTDLVVEFRADACHRSARAVA
jgi:CDP-glycerol glycerophosphotransferase (TagB/SpsB family)